MPSMKYALVLALATSLASAAPAPAPSGDNTLAQNFCSSADAVVGRAIAAQECQNKFRICQNTAPNNVDQCTYDSIRKVTQTRGDQVNESIKNDVCFRFEDKLRCGEVVNHCLNAPNKDMNRVAKCTFNFLDKEGIKPTLPAPPKKEEPNKNDPFYRPTKTREQIIKDRVQVETETLNYWDKLAKEISSKEQAEQWCGENDWWHTDRCKEGWTKCEAMVDNKEALTAGWCLVAGKYLKEGEITLRG